MIRPLALFIGLRYTRAKRRNHFVSFISGISILGITVGVWALITVLSIMNGFERELRGRIVSVAAHVTISSSRGWLGDWESLARTALEEQGVSAAAPYILGQGLLTRADAVTGVLVRGVLPANERTVSTLMQHVQGGAWDSLVAGGWQIVLGSELARALSATVGDRVTLIAPKGRITPAGLLPRMKRFTVGAIFEMDMYEYDSGLAIIHMEDAATLLESGNGVSGIRLQLADLYQAPKIGGALGRKLGPGLRLSDWTREHANFFTALKIERRVMFIILLLIITVAAFNIVSTLVMVVTDKQSDVAILRTLGLPPFQVMCIFVVQGVVIGLVGTLAGAACGVLTALNIESLVPWIEELFNIEFFPASVYVISDFPAELRWPDVATITAVSFFISLVATIYPAWRAARTEPAQALRYE